MGNPEDELSGKELEKHKHKKVVKGIAWYMVIASIIVVCWMGECVYCK